MLCRLQEVNKHWSKSPFLSENVGALSPEARDLLDKIFQTDPKQRITIPQIMQHPWCGGRLKHCAPTMGTPRRLRMGAHALLDAFVSAEAVPGQPVRLLVSEMSPHALLDGIVGVGKQNPTQHAAA
jgi:serine/threonine protein kinase